MRTIPRGAPPGAEDIATIVSSVLVYMANAHSTHKPGPLHRRIDRSGKRRYDR